MGYQTIISGYINVKEESSLSSLTKSFSFEDVYPFTNIFYPPRKVYKSNFVAFGTSLKSKSSEWNIWIDSFERFLSELDFSFARVYIESIDEGIAECIDYDKVLKPGELMKDANRIVLTPLQNKQA